MFAQLGGDLTARDLDGSTPLDLATADATKTKIRDLLDHPPKNVIDENSPKENEKQVAPHNQESEGLLTRVMSGLEGVSLDKIMAIPHQCQRGKQIVKQTLM